MAANQGNSGVIPGKVSVPAGGKHPATMPFNPVGGASSKVPQGGVINPFVKTKG